MESSICFANVEIVAISTTSFKIAYKLGAGIVAIFILAKQSDNVVIERLNTSSRLSLKMSSSQPLLAISNPPDIIPYGIILKFYLRVSHTYIVYVNYCLSADQKVIGVFSTLKVNIVTV